MRICTCATRSRSGRDAGISASVAPRSQPECLAGLVDLQKWLVIQRTWIEQRGGSRPSRIIGSAAWPTPDRKEPREDRQRDPPSKRHAPRHVITTAGAPRSAGRRCGPPRPRAARHAPGREAPAPRWPLVPRAGPRARGRSCSRHRAGGLGGTMPRRFSSARMVAGRSVRQEHAARCARCQATRWSSVARGGIRLARCHAALILDMSLRLAPAGPDTG